jgi:hypothetical protein
MFQHTSKLVFVSILSALALACDDGGGGDGGTGGGGGMGGGGGAAGMAGMAGGTGGTTGGAGGMTGGAGGMTGGAGGMTGGAGGMTGGMGGMPAPLEPKFSSIYLNVLKPSCNSGFTCHTGTFTTLDMSTMEGAYTALYNTAAMSTNVLMREGATDCADSGLLRVVPNDPAMSLLVQKLEQTQTCGVEMPPNSAPIEAAKLAAIRTWIMNGAMND